jgi:hypothetical protein
MFVIETHRFEMTYLLIEAQREGGGGTTTTKDLQHIGHKNYIKHKNRRPTPRFSYNPIVYPLKRI